MIINSITLKNFKSYENETTINLKPCNGKNIVLIGGENGAGKSTLFEAIKIGIYGATAYGYLGQNHHYTDKVKSIICNNAFTNETIETFVKLELAFNQRTEEVIYTLIRRWNYTNRKLIETFSVFMGEEELTGDAFNYFEEFLKAELPPTLFDFFFFDGEELNSMFTAHSSSSELKNAVLQLLNYNSFELLRKQLLRYNRNNTVSDSQLKEAQENYDTCLLQYEQAQKELKQLELEQENINHQISDKQVEKENLDLEFRKSGGILEQERTFLANKITSLENERSEISLKIRDYCNDTLPFLLLKNELKELANQVQAEQELASYHSFEQKLSADVIAKAYNNTLATAPLTKESANEFSKNILQQVFGEFDSQSVKEILGLSKEQEHTVMSVCNKINQNQTNVLSYYVRYNELALMLKKLRTELNNSVSDELLTTYLANIEQVNDAIKILTQKEENIKVHKETLEAQLPTLKLNLTKAKNQTIALLQGSNISDISGKLISFLETLLETLTENKVALIETEFINIFNQIIRKNNFINTLKLDKNFNSTLYITKEYRASDIINVMQNVGFNGLEHKYGSLFLEDLYSYTGEQEERKIAQKLNELVVKSMFTPIPLHTKVDIKSLSNGERQVFVLCLIWAILKVSNVNIPFIIDTPYARIDTAHRNGLTTLYLPNISKQVIILSTNEEIDQELYKTIKPYVCNEYLLEYDTVTRRTSVHNNYFEV